MPDSGSKTILVTGAAGFIGFHLSKRLLEDGNKVVGLDSLNDYYDVSLKHARLNILKQFPGFEFEHENMGNQAGVEAIFNRHQISKVVNLAAQAGVRYSLINPQAYIEANISGFLNVIEASRKNDVENFLFASSSSVYGANTLLPFSVKHNVDHPVSLYAATKKSNELIAHSYATNFNMPTTGLRFFTVYGPWGRPDMALFLFTKAILADEPIDVYNHGQMKRDFTYVDDIVEGIIRLLDKPATPNKEWSSDNPDPSTSFAPFRLYNIGNNDPVDLMNFIVAIENELGKKAKINMMPIQPGDVPETYADVDALISTVDYCPTTTVPEGIRKFVQWYKTYYK
ncbi:MAG: NAD-dependent epimerase [Cytophagales bacterium]|nr:NAD-dependent epimerase [Cytophagales bacterium]